MKKILSMIWKPLLAFLKNMWLILPLLLFASIAGYAAMIFWENNYEFFFSILNVEENKNGGTTLHEIGMVVPGAMFGVFEAFIFQDIRVLERDIRTSIRTVNAYRFLELRESKIRFTDHMMMLIIFLFIITLTAISGGYEYVETVKIMIGMITTLYLFLFLLGIEKSDPFSGRWKIDKKSLHKGWATMTVKDILEKKVPNIVPGHPEQSELSGINQTLMREC